MTAMTGHFSNARLTRKGNGMTCTSQKGNRVWVPIQHQTVALNSHELVVEFDGFDKSEDGGMYFPRNVTSVKNGAGDILYTVAEPVDLAALRQLFDRAVEGGAKRIAFRFDEPSVRVYLTTRGEVAVVENKPWSEDPDERGAYYGTIGLGGAWTPRAGTSQAIIDHLVALDHDPAAVAHATGQRTGTCCFCGRHLETNESVNAGYGPICAGKYGLPWGDSSSAFAKVRDELSASEQHALGVLDGTEINELIEEQKSSNRIGQ